MTDTEQEENDLKLREYGAVFAQLLQSTIFKQLLDTYFTFTKVVDEETKSIELQVIENPPEVIAKKLKAQMGQYAPESKIEIVSEQKARAMLKNKGKKKLKK